AHLESEILLVDEVLAVGDAAFQKKCLGKIDDVAKSGRTVILVSHNMNAIKNLCSKVVLLKDGQLNFSGNVTAGINKYLDKFKFIKEFKIFNKYNQVTNSVLYGDDMYFKIKVHPGRLSLENICLTIVLYDVSDTPVATLTNILDTMTSKQTGLLNSKGIYICS